VFISGLVRDRKTDMSSYSRGIVCGCTCIFVIQKMVGCKMDSNRKYRKKYFNRYYNSSNPRP
jgi:hypothetical protein